MRIALRELRRRPGRFLVASGLVAFLTVLLLLLGALLDGLFLGSTGAIRAQEADVFVYSADARESFLRSRVTPGLRAEIEAVAGVADTGGLGIALLGAQVPGEDEVADVSVVGYERANAEVPAPPDPGEAFADRRLRADGVEMGDVLEIGPTGAPLEVVGWVSDASFLLQGGLWVEPSTWRSIQSEARPDAAVSEGVFQVLTADAVDVDAGTLASRIDEATGGTTDTLTRDAAILSLPGTEEQNTTFTQIILTTFFVTGLVVALFFALLTLERVGLYGVLKAIGAQTRLLAVGLVTQAVAVAVAGYAVGGLLTLGLAAGAPSEIPLRFETSRAVYVAVGVLVTAILGGVVSLRRIARIDPASAIGGAH